MQVGDFICLCLVHPCCCRGWNTIPQSFSRWADYFVPIAAACLFYTALSVFWTRTHLSKLGHDQQILLEDTFVAKKARKELPKASFCEFFFGAVSVACAWFFI